MSIYVLGLNTGPHDGSAALLKDGYLVAMVEQERFSRRKHAFGELPTDAAKFCLDRGRISLQDVSLVAIGWDLPTFNAAERLPFDKEAFLRKLFPRESFGNWKPENKIEFVPHHLAHASSAFWASRFDECAILVVDGRGEEHSTTLAYGTGKHIRILKQFDIRNSLGNYFGQSTEWAGLTFWDAGKFMGLAAYGKPTQSVPLVPGDDGYTFLGMPPPHRNPRRHYLQQRLLLYRHYLRENSPCVMGDGRNPLDYADFAASVQAALEDVVVSLGRFLKRETDSTNISLAGGVALNCMANLKLSQAGIFEHMFVQPVAHDGGVSLGAALYVWHCSRMNAQPSRFYMSHAYWGPAYHTHQILKVIESKGLPYALMEEDELISYVAECLNRDQTVAWFQGPAEVGPRALGARSILGNPCRRENLARINHLKGREHWRPLAPSVQEEHFAKYFESTILSEFMIVAAMVRKQVQAMIPAVVHVDGSSRPQVVRRDANRRYWKLIGRFGELANASVLLNTSFNLKGEPMVNTPEEAIAAFLESDLDVLAIEDCVLCKYPLNH